MKNLGKAIMETGLVLVAVLALSTISQAATGDLVGNVTFSQDCTSGIGVGITYDGTNLWYTCAFGGTPDLLRADPKTGNVSASYNITGGLGAIAYDASRNVIWASTGGPGSGGIPGEIYKIQLDASMNVTGTTPAFFTNAVGINGGLVDGLGFDSTVTPNQIYYSPDGNTTIDVFDVSGTPIRSFPWNGTSCYNSGVAIGGNLLFEGSDGCNQVWVVDKNTLMPAFNFSTEVAGDPNFRDEGMTCDPNTFAPTDVQWSKEAYSPMRAHAFEIPKGTCAFGGGGGGPSFTVTKDFRFTDVNFSAIPAGLGTLLPMNGSKFNVSYVTQTKTGTVASTNPGQLYGVVTINGTGVQNITVADTFGTQFVVNPAHLNGGVDVLRVNTTTGVATVINTQVTASTVNATGPVDLTINLTTPLASDETVMVYIKYMTSLKGLPPDLSDFVNTAVVTTNLDGSKTATATINFVPHA